MEPNILSYISYKEAYFVFAMAGVVTLATAACGIAGCYGELKKIRKYMEHRDGELEKRVGNVDEK